MNNLIRRAKQSELGTIVTLLADDNLGALREEITNIQKYSASYQEILKSKYFDIHIMENKNSNEVIGLYQIMFLPHISHEGMKRAQVESVRVRRDFRGIGLGKKLIKHAIKEAKKNGCGMLQLTSDKSRLQKIDAFYKGFGFFPTHEGYKLIF